MRSKRAAMEMSVGTIVTIVLLMTVLILGLVMVRSIFQSSTSSISAIDQSVKNEINKLFSEDSSKKVILYPATREISVKKGESGGFGFSIRNTGESDETFSYVVGVSTDEVKCAGISSSDAEKLILLGKSGSNINIPSGDSLENPILVKFDIPESASLCNIRYNLDIKKSDGKSYLPTLTVDLEILPA
jgi:hypothetical protein